ncbi:long-chain-fatty-acid--CoA ligase [Winogradskyella sp. PG-2]|nr:long-chain-fatty-acid--CoA ligase [Winogradskyella sp. PG-2]
MLWVGQKLNPESPMYNMAHSFEIHGVIDEKIFKKSFQDLIDAADVFRMTFGEEKGIPFQNILKDFNYNMSIENLSNTSTSDLEVLLQQRTMQLFDVSQPLFNSTLYKLGEAHYVWFLNMHHLVTDATSSTVIFENFSKVYKLNLESQNSNTLEMPKYRDYLKYEKHITEDKAKDNIRKYWLDSAKKVTAPPVLYGESTNQTTSLSNRITVKLGEERATKLSNLAANAEIRCWTKDLTYFNIFLTSLFIYIKRVSNTEKFAIGALSHSRVTNEFKKTAGMFVELFPLVAEFSEEDTFLSIYNKVRNETNEYLRHAQPGMASTEASGGFNVVLNYIKANFSNFNGSPTKSKWIHPNHCDASHHMRFTVYDMDGTGDIELFFDLNTAIFNTSQQQYIPEHFLTVLDAFLDDTSQLINEPAITNRSSLIDKLSAFDFKNAYRPFLEVINDIIESNSETIAIRDGINTYTYSKLGRLSNALSHSLKAEGITSGDKVGVHLYRSSDYIVSLVAILKLNAVFVPIAADQPKERVAYIINNSECSLVITNSILKDNLELIAVSKLNLSTDNWQQNKSDVNIQLPESKPDQIAYILYTSGSTGKPKGVMVTHKNLSNYLFWCDAYWGKNTKFAFCTSISFDITYTAIFLPLYHGGEIIVYKEDKEGPDTSVIRMLSDDKADSIILTPSHLLLFIGKGSSGSKLKNVIVIGEDFKTDLATKIQNEYHKNLSIYNFYGPTEATIGSIITKFNLENHKKVSVPIGLPIYNTIALVLDEYLNPVPDGVIGMLYLGGYGVAKGYVKRPKLTAERFIENPYLNTDTLYNTGDLVRINADGDYEFFGRKDSQVKLNGHRIELSEIESVLEQHYAVKEAISLVIKNDDNLKKIGQLVAFYRGDSEIETSELRIHLEKQLPKYMVPLQFKYLKEFPLTQNAKTDRKKLSESSDIQFESNVTYVAPSNEIEEIIANIWSEYLDIDVIGIHDNFIALGGHSLLAMRIASALNEAFEMENPLDKIFIYPTIASYAKYIEETIISLLAE